MSARIEKGSNVLWVDFLANGKRLADPQEQLKLVNQAKAAHITHLIVDAKIPYGHVTFASSTAAPHVSEWSEGRFGAWAGRDFLRELTGKAHEAGLKVVANIDVFAEGTIRSRDGLAYEHKDWQVTYYQPAAEGEVPAFIKAEDGHEDSIFVNPLHPEVRAHQLAVIRELAENYPVDGIVLDRCRYPNIYGDFSDLSRERFEAHIGAKVESWPEDIFTKGSGEGKDRIRHGALFAEWTKWRAMNIKHFVQEAKAAFKSLRPDALFCIYVGSWYPLYYEEGVNWASTTYDAGLEWASPSYQESGYADELDFLMTGCYYPEVYMEEAANNGRPAFWYSVEGGIEVSAAAMNGPVPFIASLYLHDYENNPEQFAKAVALCRERSHGVMLFDVCYLEYYQWWGLLPALLK
ncbi:alpha amylase family protein [Paenibacillus mendelii]|uniref:Alpha amylase family protein n=1 Tax=Paenibacillus mendelii TaxID=206163 RepID=A0ABV6JBJ5_9BACL|nr:alpha amylase family protein [Paenibacillus mendelii]MCQ6558633.1 family 10 glycosylhydrolase [Paenibacillus mendelii]